MSDRSGLDSHGRALSPRLLRTADPRGARRIVYSSDPSNIAFYLTTDPARAQQLQAWVDELASSGVDAYVQDVYAQGWCLYFKSKTIEYDARPQHRRFLPMIEAGDIPLEVLIERSRERGMEFLAGIRVNDGHRHQGQVQGARFIADNRQLWLPERPGQLDYTHAAVREYLLEFLEELVCAFDVDGLELNFIRHGVCFPSETAREHQPIMTSLLTQIRRLLDLHAPQKSKRLLLGVRVPQTIAECHGLGYDVPTWIEAQLVDYVCPSDFGYADFNAPYEEFAALTRHSGCMLYPTLHPKLCRDDQMTLLSLDSCRALANNFYGAGADGISVFNYQYHWARRSGGEYSGPEYGYPRALRLLKEIRYPDRNAFGARHYRFHPLWAGGDASDADGRSPLGTLKNDRITLSRGGESNQGEYRFRICEELDDRKSAIVYFTACKLQESDLIRLAFNGNGIPDQDVNRCFHPQGRDARYGRPLPIYSTVWFCVSVEAFKYGDNLLGVHLIESELQQDESVVIDEIEVLIVNR